MKITSDAIPPLAAPPCSVLSDSDLRDYIIRAHGMATGNYVQSDQEMRQRIGAMLGKAIMADDVMRGFLGFGGPCADRNILEGSGSLSSPNIELTDSERQYLIELIDNNLEQCIRYDEDTEVSMLEGLLRKLGVDVD